MKRSIYQTKKNELLKNKARKLYRQGFTLREVGRAIKRSHEWVRGAVKELDRT